MDDDLFKKGIPVDVELRRSMVLIRASVRNPVLDGDGDDGRDAGGVPVPLDDPDAGGVLAMSARELSWMG